MQSVSPRFFEKIRNSMSSKENDMQPQHIHFTKEEIEKVDKIISQKWDNAIKVIIRII